MQDTLEERFVVLDYNLLIKENSFFQDKIEQAYGKTGHGILFVKNIPGYVEARAKLLSLVHKVATLPQDDLKELCRPEIYHVRGWSCGVQKFRGQYDTSKGSFYFNACRDSPAELTEDERKHYQQAELKMRAPNVWVDKVPEFEMTTKALSKIIISTGILVARHIDAYAHLKNPNYPVDKLSKIIQTGQAHIGRALHYFPYESVSKGTAHQGEDDWCGWHNDHGALTGLTAAMYTDKGGKELDLQEKEGGLYAKNRLSQTTKLSIPKDMLAFQLGESAQILTGGVLEATPHCVRRSSQLVNTGISRNTIALFMQPNDLEVMSMPEGCTQKDVAIKGVYKVTPLGNRWQPDILFKKFNQNTLAAYS